MGGRKNFGRNAGAGALLMVLVVLAVIAVRIDPDEPVPASRVSPTGHAVSTSDASAPVEPAAAEGRAPRSPPAGPLPPVGTPFRLAIDTLQRRARAGDPAAMCRLAAEHTECKRIRVLLASTIRMLDLEQAGLLGQRADDADAQAQRLAQTAKRSDELIEESRHCDGVPEIPDRELVHQWRAAARAGSLPALEHYALGQAFPQDKLLSLLPELATYRTEAESMARRLAEAGSRQAIAMLGLAYLPDEDFSGFSPLLSQAVEPDPVEALVMLRLAQSPAVERGGGGNRHFERFFTARIARLEAGLTPDERDAARRRLATLESGLGEGRPASAYEEHAGRAAIVDACAAAAAVDP